MHLKMSFAKWQQVCLGLYLLNFKSKQLQYIQHGVCYGALAYVFGKYNICDANGTGIF